MEAGCHRASFACHRTAPAPRAEAFVAIRSQRTVAALNIRSRDGAVCSRKQNLVGVASDCPVCPPSPGYNRRLSDPGAGVGRAVCDLFGSGGVTSRMPLPGGPS